MKVNEIIVEGAKWDAFKSGVSKIGTGIGKVAGSVAGIGRAAASAYNQGAAAIGTGYQAAATSMGGGNQIPNTPGAKATLARYKNDWEKFANDYQQGGEDLSDPANFKAVLDKFIRSKYGVDTSKYPAIQLVSVSSKSAANYIFAVTSRARADDLVNTATPTTTPAPSTLSQLPTGVAFPTASTSVTDTNGHSYTYTIPAGGSGPGQWSYNGTALTQDKDIQILNRLNLDAVNAAKAKAKP
jgi:hypothetical protein